MKSVRYTAMLDYCDGPLLFEARDDIGGHYLAMAVETAHGKDGYVVVGVAPERLRTFRAGLLDLRTLIEDAGNPEWYLADASSLAEPLAIELQTSALAQSAFLPDEGYALHETPADATVVHEARARNNLMLELVVDPPEATVGHRINLDTFVGLLDRMQKLVTHAYRAALRDIPSDQRPPATTMDPARLQVVVPAAAGSFRVLLEAEATPDLFGGNELARALHRVDTLFEHTSDPDLAVETARRNRGHLAGAYLKCLKFIAQRQTGLRYSWADPTFSRARCQTLSQLEARTLADMLSSESNLGTEEISLQGELVKANSKSGVWGLETNADLVSGKLREGSPSLNGLTVGHHYRFKCVEELTTVEGTGKEKRNLYLLEFEPVQLR